MPKPRSLGELRHINAVVVTADDLLELNDSIHHMEPSEADDPEFAWVGVAVRMAIDDDHAVALIARWVALIEFLQTNHNSPWIARNPKGGAPLVALPLFKAAALEPLLERNGLYGFERQSLLDRTLSLATTDGLE